MKNAMVPFLVAMALTTIPLSAAERYSLFEAANLIELEYQENKLSLDQKCLYLAFALRNKAELP
ncbi:MAG: hypothetical protein GTO24_01275, partial [candidate division Zixibacteria bacterium]|nr:hypothetical protein [candidate division Zixibacteria bacterium]